MKLISSNILQQIITIRPANSYKGTFGRLLAIGGNINYGGAIIMTSSAAVHAGAGLVTCACHPANLTALHTIVPEAMFLDYQDQTGLSNSIQQADVIVIGPGLGNDQLAAKLLLTVLQRITKQQQLIIDGSALTILSQHREWYKLLPPQTILTPHQMEWQRLSDIKISEQNNIEQNLKMQQTLGATVVLKKNGTVIYHYDQTVTKLAIGGPYMATGGMGDTLAGIIAAFLAQFKQAATNQVIDAAVYCHSAIAKQLAENNYVVLPSAIINALPQFMRQVITDA
ncbi:MAG: NAD(P)H-hydrate dehydratase [Liquorilactobacillus ghanensis]|uniref:ADP-dependent (S)-NAD(P)H-hydrate dehydratase n=1 Tax=Liquorilactobacillus ghanensis DSM 18630 TaxID=1423750 RepID=A0A0R1VKS0_9LACO|nr:NAD(P)H-hydrate dehydratase [Liquorilactobacillus ghanensis]KRM04395.1 sugar kinase [Liquorilactobacillus ghanensis DSM 18630]